METETVERKKLKVRPNLRFSEFEGDWNPMKLGKGIKLISGQHLSPGEYNKKEKGYPYFTGPSDFTDELEAVQKWSTVSTHYGNKNDILITVKGNGVGALLLLKLEKVAMGRQLMSIKAESFASGFIYQFLLTKLNLFIALASGNMIPGLSRQDILSIKTVSPSLPEQQKVASFLSAVDKKIQQLTRKKELLESYKKGVMQKLFSREIRFRNENEQEYPKWKEKKLKQVTSIFDGTHSTPDYQESGIPFYSVEHVTANQFEKTKFISEEVWNKENQRVKLEKNDVLMTRIGDIGTARIIDWEVRASFYVSLALLKKNDTLIPAFLGHFISSIQFQKELWKRTIHVAFPKKINLGEIGNCHVQIPEKEEQQKIAGFLSAIDKKIEAVSQQIEKTQTFKKGLLQQMFV